MDWLYDHGWDLFVIAACVIGLAGAIFLDDSDGVIRFRLRAETSVCIKDK